MTAPFPMMGLKGVAWGVGSVRIPSFRNLDYCHSVVVRINSPASRDAINAALWAVPYSYAPPSKRSVETGTEHRLGIQTVGEAQSRLKSTSSEWPRG